MLTDLQDLWLTSKKGALPNPNEVQAINVARTCEKLCLAITQRRNGLQHNTMDVTLKNHTKELTFRSVSSLYYTTLRVYELQVNDLLSRSEMLVTQSGGWSAIKLPMKRKSSQSITYNGSYTKRKRQRSVTHSIDSISFTDYTQLLDESENFVEWSKTAEVVNKKLSSNITSKTSCSHGRTRCIQIREITINEVDMRNDRYSLDDVDGFGNASADELTTMLRMMEDESIAEAGTKGTKRKMVDIPDCYEKRQRIENAPANQETQILAKDTEIEMPRCIETNNNFVGKNFSPAREINIEKSSVNESNFSFEAMSNRSVSIPTENVVTNDVNSPGRHAINTAGISKEERRSSTSNSSKSLKCPQTTKSKLIIDERTELTQAEMRIQMQIQMSLRKKLSKMRAKIKWNSKAYFEKSSKHYGRILPTTSALLSQLNRSCIVMRRLKLKRPAINSSSNINTDCSSYRNMLREILGREITDDLANEIYVTNEKNSVKNIRNRWQDQVQENVFTPQEENNYNHIPMVPQNELPSDALNLNNDLNNNITNFAENSLTTNNNLDESDSFDVMVKLLNMWRTKSALGEEIRIEYILNLTETSRKQAAKTFSALLKLAAKGFIILLAAKQSIQLEHIKLGPASAKLIQKSSDMNGITLKRRHHCGYRIHAN